MQKKSAVSVVRSGYENVYSNLIRAINLLGGLDIKSGESVVLKINLCDFRPPETGAITHPLFLEAVLRYLRKNFDRLKIYVVESDARTVLADQYIKWFGFLDLMEKWNAKWCNLSKENTTIREIKGRHFKTLGIPNIFENSYFITLPKMKTNILTKITCCLKNQFGCMPIPTKQVFHPYLDDVIVDVNLAMPPDFCIVDGMIGMGGVQAPAFGVPIQSRVLVAGRDPVAVDTVCAKIMSLNPLFIGHLRKAAQSKVGSTKYTLLGEKIKNVKVDFQWSKLEYRIFRVGSFLQKRARNEIRNKWRV